MAGQQCPFSDCRLPGKGRRVQQEPLIRRGIFGGICASAATKTQKLPAFLLRIRIRSGNPVELITYDGFLKASLALVRNVKLVLARQTPRRVITWRYARAGALRLVPALLPMSQSVDQNSRQTSPFSAGKDSGATASLRAQIHRPRSRRPRAVRLRQPSAPAFCDEVKLLMFTQLCPVRCGSVDAFASVPDAFRGSSI